MQLLGYINQIISKIIPQKVKVVVYLHRKTLKQLVMSLRGSITTSDYLPFEEYQRLVNELENDGQYMWAVYCLLSFCLALRVSDILKLRWKDIYEASSVKVTEKKTGKTKYVPIGNNTRERVTKLYGKMGKPSMNSFIIVNSHGGVISRQYINMIVKEWKKKYNLQIGNFSTHTFRKTFGRYVYNKLGRTQEALVCLNRIFRHASIQTTMIYIGLRDDEIGGIFNSIDI